MLQAHTNSTDYTFALLQVNRLHVYQLTDQIHTQGAYFYIKFQICESTLDTLN